MLENAAGTSKQWNVLICGARDGVVKKKIMNVAMNPDYEIDEVFNMVHIEVIYCVGDFTEVSHGGHRVSRVSLIRTSLVDKDGFSVRFLVFHGSRTREGEPAVVRVHRQKQPVVVVPHQPSLKSDSDKKKD